MQIANFVDRWLGRASGMWTFAAPIVPGTIGALVTGYLAKSAHWLSELGPFGWWSVGVAAFVLITSTFSLAARAKLWRVMAQERARVSGDGSPFNPMARVYENKRLYLRDLAPLGRLLVHDKKFVNCEIIGPGTAIIGLQKDPSKPSSQLKDCNTFDVDRMEIDPNMQSKLAIAFWDCDFDGCEFYHMTMLFTARYNDTLHWMTPDFRQPKLIGDQKDG